jgi:hypothetical protein
MPAMRPRGCSHAGCYPATSWLQAWEELQNLNPKSAVNREPGAADYANVHKAHGNVAALKIMDAHELAAQLCHIQATMV